VVGSPYAYHTNCEIRIYSGFAVTSQKAYHTKSTNNASAAVGVS